MLIHQIKKINTPIWLIGGTKDENLYFTQPCIELGCLSSKWNLQMPVNNVDPYTFSPTKNKPILPITHLSTYSLNAIVLLSFKLQKYNWFFKKLFIIIDENRRKKKFEGRVHEKTKYKHTTILTINCICQDDFKLWK